MTRKKLDLAEFCLDYFEKASFKKIIFGEPVCPFSMFRSDPYFESEIVFRAALQLNRLNCPYMGDKIYKFGYAIFYLGCINGKDIQYKMPSSDLKPIIIDEDRIELTDSIDPESLTEDELDYLLDVLENNYDYGHKKNLNTQNGKRRNKQI